MKNIIKKILSVFVSLSVLAAFPACGETLKSARYPELPYKELIFPAGTMPSSHAPSITELPNGELLVAWHGERRAGQKAVIWASRKPAEAGGWSKPYIINSTAAKSNKNPVLYMGPEKKLFLFWGDEEKLWLKINIDTLRMKTSEDYGHTWSRPRDVGKFTWFLPRTHPIKLADGSIVLPIYTDMLTSSAVAISDDNGLTWKGPRYILLLFGIQPTIIQRSDFSLFALMRTGMWPRLCWQAISYNMGWNWKMRRLSGVKNPGFSLEMVKLKSGNVVLAFNDSRTDRSSLSIALSRDEGRTWPHVKTIECNPERIYGYPSVIQDKEGLIHVVYSYENRRSIAHFVTDESWLKN